MCLSVPGKIIKIENNEAIVDYDVEKRKGIILEDDSEQKYSAGDYVIIQGGFVVQKIDKDEALRSLEMYKKALKED